MAVRGDTTHQRHRVRVATVVIDAVDLLEAAAFWSAALDTPVLTGLRLLLQRVPEGGDDKNAVHLDLETDDPQAEVTRLTALGASQERPLGHGAWVLQDPAGNRFCVIYPETPGWPQGTKVVTGPTPTGP